MSGFRERLFGGGGSGSGSVATRGHLLTVVACLLVMFVQPARTQFPTTTPRTTGKPPNDVVELL